MSLALSNRDGGKTSERGLYDSIGAHLSGEVISGFRVRQADPVSMNVRVGGEYNSTTGSGKDSILIRDGLRTYDVFIDDGVAVTATVSAAHASLARIDTVVVYVDKSVARTKTLVDNTNGVVKVKVVSGTPNASPVAPDDTAIQSSVGSGNPFAKLANIAVAANATNILDSHITDKRNYASVSNLSGVFSDYIVPGTGVIAVSSGLTCTISDITYYINGIRYTKTGISNKTFTASKDTYCFIDTAGTITYTEVANNAAAPAAPANSICFDIVASGASSISNVSALNRTSGFSSKYIEQNGWTVLDHGGWKEYLIKKSYNSSFAMPAGQLNIDSVPLPVGMTDFRTKNVQVTVATSNAQVVLGGYIGGASPDFNTINVYLYNTGGAFTLNYWHFFIRIVD